MRINTYRPRPESVTIKPGPLGLDYYARNDIHAHWFGGNPLLSAFWTAFAGQFPQGERFLIASVRLFRDQVTDKTLQKDISGFIGQEAHHAVEHTALNAFFTSQNLPTDRIDRQTGWVIRNVLLKMSKKNQLAATAALEHFTSMFGDLVLINPELLDSLPESIKPVFLWHAIEETEHKAVAFDVYQAVIGGYWRLMGIYVFTTTLLVINSTWFALGLMARNGSLFRLGAHLSALNWMFGFGKGHGYVRRMLPELFTFFRPSFHPWQRDNSANIVQWKPVLEEMLQHAHRR